MNLKKKEKVVVGDVRKSQLISTFGIGSMVDFVHQTVMICGVDDWDTGAEYRLNNRNLENLLGVKYFVAPKSSERNYSEPNPDIKATVFPRKLYSPVCNSIVDVDDAYFDPYSKDYRCKCERCRRRVSLLPSPFVLVCPEGHIEDFPYSWWVHGGGECPEGDKGNIVMRSYQNRSDLDNLYLECSCGAKRSMGAIGGPSAFAGYRCHGMRPWLGDSVECDGTERKEYMRMRRRAESSVYFPVTVSALTVPPWDTKLSHKIQEIVSDAPDDVKMNKEVIEYHVKILSKEFPSADRVYIHELFEKALYGERARSTLAEIMEDEYRAITELSRDADSDCFVLREEDVPDRYSHLISRVIAAEKLTVVTAMVGFSMLGPTTFDSGRLCRLSKERKPWYPGVEQKGEGVFIEFDRERLNAWAEKHCDYYDHMHDNLEKSKIQTDNFSVQYVFLHTFAHLFIRELSSICGYSAASIKERIYSTYDGSNIDMCGVLVYTSTPDSDGSLGGLVEQAKKVNMERIIDSMLERGKWCSADPVCYTSRDQGYNSLNYAACFACTLLPETSCERFNALLDRCAVCGMPEDPKFGFMNLEKDD